MKKILSIIVSIVLLFSFSLAVAETNLSELSYDELLALQQSINEEMKSRPEWKGVLVPAGIWTVGVDIPAGVYSISVCKEGQKGKVSVFGKEIDDFVSNGGCIYPLVFGYEYNTFGKVELKDGYKINITVDVYFAPPLSLGF